VKPSEVYGRVFVIYPADEDPGAEAVAEYVRELAEELTALDGLGKSYRFPKVWREVFDDAIRWYVGWPEGAVPWTYEHAVDPLSAARALHANLEPQQKPVEDMTDAEFMAELSERGVRIDWDTFEGLVGIVLYREGVPREPFWANSCHACLMHAVCKVREEDS